MTTASWNGTVIAESDDIVTVEGNAYFPRESVRDDVLRDSDTHTVCPWKGTASYFDVEVDGEVNRDAAWYYPTPKDAAREITAARAQAQDCVECPECGASTTPLNIVTWGHCRACRTAQSREMYPLRW